MNKKTPLFETHKKLGAKIVDFHGWLMPIWYSSIKEEHLAVRNSAGIFDVSHMGEFKITGNDATNFANYIITNDVRKIGDNQSLYAVMCNNEGGIIDDLLVYKFSEKEYLFVVNASNIEKDFKWLLDNKRGFDIEIKDISSDTSLIAIQGEQSLKVLEQTFNEVSILNLNYYHFMKKNINGKSCIISRTGYTGEIGFEIFCSSSDTQFLWNKLSKDFVSPCGLAARDSLRLEAGYPLYGNELNDSLNPFSANLGWVVKLEKENFLGDLVLKNAKRNGIDNVLKGFIPKGNKIPRQGMRIYSGSTEAGYVTSGSYSFVLNRPIGLGYIKRGKENEKLSIEIRGEKIELEITELPFVKHRCT